MEGHISADTDTDTNREGVCVCVCVFTIATKVLYVGTVGAKKSFRTDCTFTVLTVLLLYVHLTSHVLSPYLNRTFTIPANVL